MATPREKAKAAAKRAASAASRKPPTRKTVTAPPTKKGTTQRAPGPTVPKSKAPSRTVDDPYGGLVGDDRNAYVALTNLFKQYDLGTLSGTILKYIQDGYSADTISILLQDTKEYKERFAANAARQKAGLPVLSPAEYISTERSYRQVMQSAGLPVGFYDSSEDFRKFLEMDVSPTEVQGRVTTVSEAINKAPAATRDYFKQWYSTGDMVAYALDPTKAAPLIEERIKAAQAAAVAQEQGFGLSRRNAELIGNTGASFDNIQAGVGTVGADLSNSLKLGEIYGVDYDQDDLVEEVFTNNAQATLKRRGLASQERAAFSGASGQTTGSLSRNGAGSI